MADPTVVHEPRQTRWEVRVDGRLAGFTEYFVKDDRFVFVHTEIDDEFAGMGLGSLLARGALDEVGSMGRSLVPLCPFIRSWIGRHPDYEGLVDEVMLARFDERRREKERSGN